ncbi:MAG: restriction endonuclease subunit S, partial [Flavobacterium sp.]
MKILLKDFSSIHSGGSAPDKSLFSKTGKPFIRAGSLEFLVRGISIENCERLDDLIAIESGLKIFPKNSILFAKSGMSAKMGRIYILPSEAYVVSHLAIIVPDEKIANPLFIKFYFSHKPPFNLIKDAAYPSISLKDIGNIKIDLPDLETQDKIVAILDKAKNLIEKRERTITKFEELLTATFWNIFGDPIKNEKGWDKIKLSKLGTFKNGMNFSRNENGYKLHCIGVSDFKKLSRFSDIKSLPFINLDKKPTQDYLLKNGDIIFVRSNGSKELVGRSLEIAVDNEDVTFSGFCIRFRCESKLVNTTYLNHLFRLPSFKSKMLEGGRGANIQNINQDLLGHLDILLPNLNLQNKFSEIVIKIESNIEKLIQSKIQLENLLNGLSQSAFNGELEFN